jgi:hypothetical protein
MISGAFCGAEALIELNAPAAESRCARGPIPAMSSSSRAAIVMKLRLPECEQHPSKPSALNSATNQLTRCRPSGACRDTSGSPGRTRA